MSTKICKLAKIESALSKREDNMKIIKVVIYITLIIAIALLVGYVVFTARQI